MTIFSNADFFRSLLGTSRSTVPYNCGRSALCRPTCWPRPRRTKDDLIVAPRPRRPANRRHHPLEVIPCRLSWTPENETDGYKVEPCP